MLMKTHLLSFVFVALIATSSSFANNLSLIGDATPGGWSLDSAIVMKPVADGIYEFVGDLKDGSLKFACYSPATENIKHNYPTDTYSKVGYVQPNETALTWDLLLAPTTGAYTAETASENVPVAFEHALAWITFQVKAKDADAENIFDIKKVTIKNVCTKANFEVKMADGIQYEEWEKQGEKKDIVVFDGSQVVKQEAKDIETTPQGTIIIPQATEGTELVIEYTQLAVPGSTAELTDQKITLPLTLNPTRSVWEPGKHYTYTLTFKVEEIRIKPTVKPWGNVNVENIL